MEIIINSPSLNPAENVSGISAVTRFIIDNNGTRQYVHFTLGRKDKERGGWRRVAALVGRYGAWKRLLGEHPGALIHYNLPLSRASLLRDPWFMGYALRHHRRMVVHVHGGRLLTAGHIPLALRPVLKWIFGRKVTFVALSEGERDTLKERFGARRVEVLPNCVDLADARDYAREKEKPDGDGTLRVGYLGRIEPNKGMTELLEAGTRLKEAGVDFRLCLAGKEQTEGEYLPEFRQRLDGRFRYKGVVSGRSKCDFLRSLDVFVLPTYFEGLPMSLLECMSYGIVPVTTPVGSIPQVVRDGANGLFIQPHDVESIVEALRRLDKDRSLLRRLGEEARKTIFDKFSTEEYIKKLNEIYHELTSSTVWPDRVSKAGRHTRGAVIHQ